MQFEHVFASERVRRGKIQCDANVNGGVIRIAEACEMRQTCLRKTFNQAARDLGNTGT